MLYFDTNWVHSLLIAACLRSNVGFEVRIMKKLRTYSLKLCLIKTNSSTFSFCSFAEFHAFSAISLVLYFYIVHWQWYSLKNRETKLSFCSHNLPGLQNYIWILRCLFTSLKYNKFIVLYRFNFFLFSSFSEKITFENSLIIK